MDVGEFFRLMRRRWLVTVPALVVTILATAAAAAAVPVQYETQVQMTLLNAPKITAEQGNYGNPYLAFDQALLVDDDLLTRNLSSDAAGAQLAALGVTDQYTATIANNALGPFMLLTVTGTNKQHIMQSMQTLIQFSKRSWLRLQQSSSAPPGSIVGLGLIAPPSPPTPVIKRKIEVVAGVAILGLLATILLAAMVDGMIRRRRGGNSGPDSSPSRERSARVEWSARAERSAPAVPMR